MPLYSTPEQRIAVGVKLAMRRGLSEHEAIAEAYAKEGLAPPRSLEQDLEEEIEELHWKLACAERQAAAATKRAAKLLEVNRFLMAEIKRYAEETGDQALVTLYGIARRKVRGQ